MSNFFAAIAFGLWLGAAYVAALRANTKLYVSGGRLAHAVIVHIARVAGVAFAFLLAAHAGRDALWGCFIGFAVARTSMVHHWSASDAP